MPLDQRRAGLEAQRRCPPDGQAVRLCLAVEANVRYADGCSLARAEGERDARRGDWLGKEHADGLCGAKGEVHPPAEAARRAANAAGDVHDQGPLRADLDVELGELRAQLEGGGAVAQKERTRLDSSSTKCEAGLEADSARPAATASSYSPACSTTTTPRERSRLFFHAY